MKKEEQKEFDPRILKVLNLEKEFSYFLSNLEFSTSKGPEQRSNVPILFF